ncbi:hypothetical protein OIU76_004505 [Salix suchowensis]|nr:hypothetical protein IMY05_003G0038600 [Salix suchowensis]KAJ6348022.1 hypothetical protein OIU76_004505 [Salix suchowensis]
MANSSKSSFHLLLVYASLLVPSSCYSQHPWPPSGDVAMFVFGDSLFDSGNNNYLKSALGRADFWPYGETFFKHPTGRFSDGRIIPDFIAEYLNLPLIAPYLQPGNHQYLAGVNFASGGAGALVETNKGLVIDLKTQLSYFRKVKQQLGEERGDTETRTLLSKAIYLFSIGSNDYVAPFSTNFSAFHSYSRKDYVGMVVGNLTAAIKEIYENGGRRFGFLNVEPLGCSPYARAVLQNNTRGCVDELTVLAKLHNRELAKALKELTGQLKGFKYSNFDFYTSLSERINHPSKYGFKKGRAACCGTGAYRGIPSCGGKRTIKEYQLCDDAGEHLFFDANHPSEKANHQFAELMWKGRTGPHNLRALIQE